MKKILITGVSSGTGLELTKKFLESGFKVIGSVRNPSRATELQNRFGQNFHPLVFDINDHSQVDEAAGQLSSMPGEDKITALINNAGTAEIGPLLHVSMENLRKHLETLVVGHLYVIQKFFPHLISASGTPGRIYNISSISGAGANFLFGCYAAGKHALEGLSKTLREELKLYGIKVIVVAPGNIATSIWMKQSGEVIEKYAGTDYYPFLKNAVEKLSSGTIQDMMTMEEFAEAFMRIFREKEPAERYTIVRQAADISPQIIKK